VRSLSLEASFDSAFGRGLPTSLRRRLFCQLLDFTFAGHFRRSGLEEVAAAFPTAELQSKSERRPYKNVRHGHAAR
jgi:hypothetical protein